MVLGSKGVGQWYKIIRGWGSGGVVVDSKGMGYR